MPRTRDMSVTPLRQGSPLRDRWRQYSLDINTLEPMMFANDRKTTLQALPTYAVVKAAKSDDRNVVLDDRPPPINNSEKDLIRKECATLTQLRSGHCGLLGSYKSRIKKDTRLNVCIDCGMTPHDVVVFPFNHPRR